jgi:hypothetical protein
MAKSTPLSIFMLRCSLSALLVSRFSQDFIRTKIWSGC